MAGEDVGAPPDRLWVHQEGIYRDEYQRTWVAVVEQVTVRFFFAYFFIDFFCFQSSWFLTSRSLLKVFGFLFSVVSFHQGTSFLRARIQQVQVPLGDAVRPSHLLTSQLPLMWQLYPAQRYMDNNSRLWQIQHHLMVHMLLNFPSHRGSL